ncbi:MAG: endonuclease/exonuclease/phosphatase family protein [Verrucomicrobiota bacterium]
MRLHKKTESNVTLAIANQIAKSLLAVILLGSGAILESKGERDAGSKPSNEPLIVLCFNIRIDNPKDGENAWPNRKDFVAALIRFHKADLIGMQEARPVQIEDLEAALPDYSWYGVGQNDGNMPGSGSHNVIFYRKDRFKLLKQGAFWCSETPDTPSLGWDATNKRTVSWVKLEDAQNGRAFYHFNTHFSHVSEQARKGSAQLLRQRMDQIVTPTTLPVIVTGDLNATPEAIAYETMTSSDFGRIQLFDAGEQSETGRYGPGGTFNRFDIARVPEQPIDYIFVTDHIRVKRFGVLSDSSEGRLPSDHYPVLAEILFR